MSRFRLSALAFCLFCLIVGARWALYHRYGTDLPQWDQWDAEGLAIFYPLSIGQFHYFSNLWRAHNEHHVALTKLLAWALTELNGQWDQRLEAVVNATLPGTIAASFLWLAARRLNWRWIAGLSLLLAACYALPVASQNCLSGFDSQQFFLIGLAFGAIATLPFAEPFRRQWWFGAACAILSLGSMGSGFFAAAVVAGMLVVQIWRKQRDWRSAIPGLAVCAVAVAVGVMTRVIVAGHEDAKAQNAIDFLMSVVRALSWPAFDFGWSFAALILAVPWVWVMVRTVGSQRRPRVQWDEFLSGLGLWVFFQILATAYARGVGGGAPASRYIDTLVIGLIVNLLCLHSLWSTEAKPSVRRSWLRFLLGGWVLLCGLGTIQATQHIFAQDLPPLVDYNYYCEQNVRNYLITHDYSYLQHEEIPYPSDWVLKGILDYPAIAALLPVSSRVPFALSPSLGMAGFIRNDSRVPENLHRLPPAAPAAGLPPSVPVLSNAITWGSFGSGKPAAAQWRSLPLPAMPGRWLKFELAGQFGKPGIGLELRDPKTERVLAIVAPDKQPGNQWRSAYVRAPKEAFVIVARDDSVSGWMAFSEPIEMASGSYWAWQAVRHGGILAAFSGLLVLGILAVPRKSA